MFAATPFSRSNAGTRLRPGSPRGSPRSSRKAVEERGGSVIEFRGDEALAVFVSSRQAIVAAALLQDRFVEHTVADPSLPLPVGIGLDVGEAVQLETGYRGGALNLAARLCGTAGPGEILASQSVVHLAGKVDNVRYSDRGDLHLKGLADPVRVFRVISEAGDPSERIKPFLALQPQRRASAPLRLAERHRALALLLVLALVGAIVLPAWLVLRGGGSDRISGDALALVGVESGELEGSVPLEARPGDIDVGDGAVWVTLPDRGAVVQVDPETMGVVDTVPVGADPSGIAIGAGSVWVTNGGGSTVSRISPARNSVVQVVEVPEGPASVAVGQDGVWVANSLNDSVSHLDPGSGEVLRTIEVGDQPVGLAVDESGVVGCERRLGNRLPHRPRARSRGADDRCRQQPAGDRFGVRRDLGGQPPRRNRLRDRSGHQRRRPNDPRRRFSERRGGRR